MIKTGADATIFNMQASLCLYCLIDDHSVLFYYLFMISSNIAALRKKHRWTQEALANKVGVSRQTIAKWEAPGGNPDISSCVRLAHVFDVAIDDLVNGDTSFVAMLDRPGKYIFGTVVIDRDGRLTLPVRARKVFNIKAGDELLLIGDIDRGLALMDKQFFVQAARHVEGDHRAAHDNTKN